MFLIDFALLLGCGFIYIGLATNVVDIVPRYSSTYITLTCTVKDVNAIKFMIHLTCPFIKIGFCYSNCKASCEMTEHNVCKNNSKVSVISNCELDVSNENQISTTYRIDTRRLDETGDWRCSFKNHKSDSISLAKYEHPTTPQYLTESEIRTRIETDSVENKLHTNFPVNIHNVTKESKKRTVKIGDVESRMITHYLTRPEIILLMLIILGFSLILNLSFLIRCIMLKSVVDKYRREIPISSCTLSCLCIDNYTRQRRYSKGLNFSNQTGSDFYRCQPMFPENVAIYDDLSAISNNSARLKLRFNNNSDIDDEAKLINVIPNTGYHVNSISMGSVTASLPGRHANQNHATYLHSGLGNYVIVSGPIANPDQYTIGSNTPGYPLQIVTPISSTPGSPIKGSGSHVLVQSINCNEIIDSEKNQSVNIVHDQLTKTNFLHTECIDPNHLIDLSYSRKLSVNCCNPNCQTSNNQTNLQLQNGLTNFYPFMLEKVPTSTSTSTITFS